MLPKVIEKLQIWCLISPLHQNCLSANDVSEENTPIVFEAQAQLLDQIRHKIRLKDHGIRTEQAYVDWSSVFSLLNFPKGTLFNSVHRLGLHLFRRPSLSGHRPCISSQANCHDSISSNLGGYDICSPRSPDAFSIQNSQITCPLAKLARQTGTVQIFAEPLNL